MKFGIHIGHMGGPLEEMRRLWKFAEAQGFDWFSVSDHFQESPPRGGDLDCYEAIATLTAAAMDTRRIRLGSGVYCVAYRNPGLLAKSLTTIDHLSGGRVDCGLGAGWHDVEAKAFGFPFPSIGPREDMLEEYAQIMRLLFDPEQPRVTFEGRHFRMQNAPNNPKPLQPRIPIWIGGRGEKRTLRAAARYADGWNAAYIGPGDWVHKSQVLDRWCETEKRDPKKSCAPSTWASTWAPTPAAPRAPRRCSTATGAAASTGPTAPATCGARSRTPASWSTSSARWTAPGSASRSAKAPTTGPRSRPSRPRSCAPADERRASGSATRYGARSRSGRIARMRGAGRRVRAYGAEYMSPSRPQPQRPAANGGWRSASSAMIVEITLRGGDSARAALRQSAQ